MVVIDCDVINHPSQLMDCSLAPIAVYIKMEPAILEKLVKLRGSKRKNLGAQVVAAQKLAQCNEVRRLLDTEEASSRHSKRLWCIQSSCITQQRKRIAYIDSKLTLGRRSKAGIPILVVGWGLTNFP